MKIKKCIKESFSVIGKEGSSEDGSGFEYLRVVCDHDGVFPEMIAYLQERGMTLAGAVHDFTCPQSGTNYMYFPIRRL